MKRVIVFVLGVIVLSNAWSQSPSRRPEPVVKTVGLKNGVSLQYTEQGSTSGTPVIFLHGFTDSRRSFDLVLRHLSSNIHAFAVSQRGHGNSSKPQDGYKPSDFSSDIAQLIEVLKIGPAIVVGHSMGSIIAKRLALDYPQYVRGLVLVGAFESFNKNAGVLELRDLISTFKDPVDTAFVKAFQESTIVKPVPKTFFNTVIEESLKLPAHVWKRTIQGLMDVNYSSELAVLNKPTLIIWGDKDAFSPYSDQQSLLKTIKGSQLITYAGTGHAPNWEIPKKFAADVVAFTRGLEASKQ